MYLQVYTGFFKSPMQSKMPLKKKRMYGSEKLTVCRFIIHSDRGFCRMEKKISNLDSKGCDWKKSIIGNNYETIDHFQNDLQMLNVAHMIKLISIIYSTTFMKIITLI